MNQGLVDAINLVVKDNDDVYCFGDFSLNWQGAEMRKYLNGNWFLIPGNHDKCHSVFHKEKEEKKRNAIKRYEQLGFVVLPEKYSFVLKSGDEEISAQACHFPYKEDHGNFESTPRYQKYRPEVSELCQVLLHGHVHNAWKSRFFWDESGKRFVPQINLGVDAWDWKPISEDELFAFAKKELDEAAAMTELNNNEEIPDEGT
jgi:calcineurin-like phosphoesterase family protein